MDIIIEQVGKITALFLFLRPKAFRLYVLFRAAANNNYNNNYYYYYSISKECLWCFAMETLPLYFRSLKG